MTRLASSLPMDLDDQSVLQFLAPQLRDFGGKVELDTGLWLLFAVPATDEDANALARSILSGATFPLHSGASQDDQWTLHYVEEAHRRPAMHWLNDLAKVVAGDIRTASPTTRALVQELTTSDKPHRVAQQLADLHTRGEVAAGLIRDPAFVRQLLDRLHQREPLFYSAFQILLSQHLIDMLVLHRRLIVEDVALMNDLLRSNLSRDPFLQSRQDATADIRNQLIRFQIINPLDQQKNNAIANPYAVFLDLKVAGEQVTFPLDGITAAAPRTSFLSAIRSIRRNLYRGEEFSSFDTQAPWMNQEIAYPFRFIKLRLDSRRDLSVMDALYMMERALDA